MPQDLLQEGPAPFALGLGEEGVRRCHLGNLALIHEHHLVGDMTSPNSCVTQIIVMPSGKLFDNLKNLGDHFRISAGCHRTT